MWPTASFAGLFDSTFGADGPKDADDNDVADADAITYALGILAPGVDSGLDDALSGEDVILGLNGGVVEGRTALGNLLVFTVSVDASGVVTLNQSRAVVHDDPNDPDEAGSPAQLAAANLITLTATITDGDGDTDTAIAEIGGSFLLEDDGPTAQVDVNATLDTLGARRNEASGHETDGDSDPPGVIVQANFADNFVAPGRFWQRRAWHRKLFAGPERHRRPVRPVRAGWNGYRCP